MSIYETWKRAQSSPYWKSRHPKNSTCQGERCMWGGVCGGQKTWNTVTDFLSYLRVTQWISHDGVRNEWEEECKFATKFVWEQNQAGLELANPPALVFRLLGLQVHMYHTPSLGFSGVTSVTIRLSLVSGSLDLSWCRATRSLAPCKPWSNNRTVESGLSKTSKRKGKSIINTHINL